MHKKFTEKLAATKIEDQPEDPDSNLVKQEQSVMDELEYVLTATPSPRPAEFEDSVHSMVEAVGEPVFDDVLETEITSGDIQSEYEDNDYQQDVTYDDTNVDEMDVMYLEDGFLDCEEVEVAVNTPIDDEVKIKQSTAKLSICPLPDPIDNSESFRCEMCNKYIKRSVKNHLCTTGKLYV